MGIVLSLDFPSLSSFDSACNEQRGRHFKLCTPMGLICNVNPDVCSNRERPRNICTIPPNIPPRCTVAVGVGLLGCQEFGCPGGRMAHPRDDVLCCDAFCR